MKLFGRLFIPVLVAIIWWAIPDMNATPPNAHYWIDHDKLIEGTAALNGELLSLDIDVSKYPGAHTLYYRIQDLQGNWSAPICVPFISNPQTSGGSAKSFEYWIDKESDRRQTKDIADNVAFFDLNCEDLALGAHNLYYRVEDQFGNFGSVRCHVFYKSRTSGSSITWYRYWWNDHYDLSEEIAVTTGEPVFLLDTELKFPDNIADENNSSHQAYLSIIFGDDSGNVSPVWNAVVDYERFILDVKELDNGSIWTCHANGNNLILSGLTPGDGILRIFALNGQEISTSIPHEENQIYSIGKEKVVIVCYKGLSKKILIN